MHLFLFDTMIAYTNNKNGINSLYKQSILFNTLILFDMIISIAFLFSNCLFFVIANYLIFDKTLKFEVTKLGMTISAINLIHQQKFIKKFAQNVLEFALPSVSVIYKRKRFAGPSWQINRRMNR